MELPPALHENLKMYKLISEKIGCANNTGLIMYITKKFRENIIKEIEDKCDYMIICNRILDEFENYLKNNSKEKILLEIEEFQQKYIYEKNVKPQLLSINDTNINKAVELLKNGELVAFPTETVYGLGANGLNSEAVQLIYKWKGRPSNNPVILHIAKLHDIYHLIDVSSKMINVINIIGEKFWPGPLTLVVNASDIVPLEVTANTGFVGIRIPNDSVALKLLDKCDFPIAAPSANLSGHISPTNYSHVYVDFINKPLTILEDSENCSKRIGIESSIITPLEIIIYSFYIF
jgi:tRNA threonylcarbamoyl adenosine modification protein (Sua5/YciO/YrdC/YwlC family)